MQSTYSGSTICLWSKGSLSFSFYDQSCLFNERFDRTPLTSSSCCACCAANFIHGVPINPGFLYGLRQSTLIQWAPSRRLILGGGDRYYCRIPVYGIDRGCYEVCCTIKKKSGNGRSGVGRNGKIECMVSGGKSGRHHLSGEVDAEAVISLLSEDVVEGSHSVRETYERVLGEKRRNLGNECDRRTKKNIGLASSESCSKRESQSVRVGSRGEGFRRREEKEAALRGENHGLRKEGSSCSSYYSFSSSSDLESKRGEFEGKDGVQVRHGAVVRESSSGYIDSLGTEVGESSSRYKDSSRTEVDKFDGEVGEEFGEQGDEADGQGVVSKWGYTSVGSGVEWEKRKKSEKKLSEVSTEQTEAMEESSRMHSKVSRIEESSFGQSSDSHEQLRGREEKLTLAGNLDETRKQYGQKGKHVIGQLESGRNYQRLTEMSEVQGNDVETTSRSQKQFRGREDNMSMAVNLVQERREEHQKKPTETLEIQEVDIRNTSTSLRHQGTTMKNWNENSASHQSSVQDTKEQHHRTGEWLTAEINSRKKFQQFTGISDIRESDIKNTAQTRSETRMTSWEGNSNLTSSLHPEAKEQLSKPDKRTIRRNESRKGSQDATSISVVHANDTQTTISSQRTSEKKASNQEVYLSSVVKSDEESGEKNYQTDERWVQIGSRKEAERPSKLLNLIDSASEESSSTQESLNLVAQAQIVAEKRDKTGSQTTLKPSRFQLVGEGPLNAEPTSGFAAQEVEIPESSSSSLSIRPPKRSPSLQYEPHGEAGRGETHGMSLNVAALEDALGSADRLEKSSMHFVGEFVEELRHSTFTAEIQKEEIVSEVNLPYKGEIPENFQLKEHDSRRSSGGSGTKGPSDEMWDVTNPSPHEPSKMEAAEGTTATGNAIVKRNSRSFWNVIADIIRIRWGSHSETNTSVMKSGGKSSSNESVSSDAWFSGHEPDEHNDEKTKREKRSVRQESIPADHPQLGKTPTLHQGESVQATSTKDNIKQVEPDMPSFSSVLESGSALKSHSSASRKESLGWYENAESFQGSPSSSMMVESSIPPLQARHIRRFPAVEEISSTTKTDGSGSASTEKMDQKAGGELTEVSGTEGKDGELKRRKLRRNKQVLKDRFDEWEEAYALESEQRKIDETFMREALLEAKKAANAWEVPVGAVLVQHGKIIARGCNLVEELRDSTAHAEMICIREASNLLRTWRLSETTLYVTLEPCPMCAGAILQARIDALVWGAPNKLLGADGSWIRLFPSGGEEGGNGSESTDKPQAPVHPFHPKMTIRRGVLASECSDAMQQFFQLRRKKKEKKPDPPTPPSCLPISNQPSKLLTKIHDIFHMMFCL